MTKRNKAVAVIVRFDITGTMTPLAFDWVDGKRMDIDEVIKSSRQRPNKAGEDVLCYHVKADNMPVCLFFNCRENIWYVEQIAL